MLNGCASGQRRCGDGGERRTRWSCGVGDAATCRKSGITSRRAGVAVPTSGERTWKRPYAKNGYGLGKRSGWKGSSADRCSELLGVARSCSELLGVAWSCSELLGVARSCSELLGVAPTFSSLLAATVHGVSREPIPPDGRFPADCSTSAPLLLQSSSLQQVVGLNIMRIVHSHSRKSLVASRLRRQMCTAAGLQRGGTGRGDVLHPSYRGRRGGEGVERRRGGARIIVSHPKAKI
jgi:hypothetical protein